MYCNIYRGKFIESRHKIHAVVINKNNNILFQCGNPEHITCIRSSFKPFQAYPIIQQKGHIQYQFTNSEIALLCASHSGEPRHIRAAKSMLNKIACTHKLLECGKHLPLHLKTQNNIIQKNIQNNQLYNNCSGKHIGMLTLSKILKHPIKNYINDTHIVQKKIFQALYHNHNLKPLYTGVDGCGAMAPFFKLLDIAKLYIDFGTSVDPNYQTLYKAITQHPYMIAGKARFDSVFIDIMKGQGLCKGGGEGVIGLYTKSKRHGEIAIALKVEDGNHRARSIAITDILSQIKALSQSQQKQLDTFCHINQFNHNNRKIGFISTEISKLS